MPIITLTSDWGTSDYYAGAVKGAILRRLPEATIVDISHAIKPLDIKHAAIVLRNTYRSFPENSVHIIAVHEIESLEHPHLIVKAAGHYFIGTDTGIFSLFLDTEPELIIAMQVYQDTPYFTFPARDRFAKTACHIASGGDIRELGTPVPSFIRKLMLQPAVEERIIKGHVMYIDAYENVLLDVSIDLFQKTVGKKPFELNFRRMRYRNLEIMQAYGDVGEGVICVLFSTTGYLEIAVNQGKAASLFGLHVDDQVNLEF
jgi:S-adenosylmethionine hydrolase